MSLDEEAVKVLLPSWVQTSPRSYVSVGIKRSPAERSDSWAPSSEGEDERVLSTGQKTDSRVKERRVWPLVQKDPLEKEMATHSSILAWRIPWTEESGRLQSVHGGCKESDMTEQLTLSFSFQNYTNIWYSSNLDPPALGSIEDSCQKQPPLWCCQMKSLYLHHYFYIY